jgi:hypothetical protein
MVRARHLHSGFGQPSGADVWEIGLAPMPAFVPGDDGQPVRPLVALVVDSSGRIRGSAIGHPDRPHEALAPAIEMAIEEPQEPCVPGLPRRAVVASSRLLKLVPSLLPGVMVTRGDTPRLDHATSSLREHMADGAGQRGLQGLTTYLSVDVTTEAVESFSGARQRCIEGAPGSTCPARPSVHRDLRGPAHQRLGWLCDRPEPRRITTATWSRRSAPRSTGWR